MLTPGYRLPNGAIPLLLSADTRDLVRDDAAAILSYCQSHPQAPPQHISDMIYRTRVARRHRALAMVTSRDELLSALRAVVQDRSHPAVLQPSAPAAAGRVAYVCPGQGSQRPGMARLFYETNDEFRSEVNRCVEVFDRQFAQSARDHLLDYLLDEDFPAIDAAGTVQPALFTHMAGLAAMWRSFGIAPDLTIGHSQGEIAAAYIAGMVSLDDAALVVGTRARAVDGLASDDYAMGVMATDRDSCEAVLARCSGWAELSVVNSPSMVGVSGDRGTVQAVVDEFSSCDVFARIVRVEYPAHTSLIHRLTGVRAQLRDRLTNHAFLETETPCVGSTLGAPITADLPVDQYWFWNLRNPVRFDKAVAAAMSLGADVFVELAEHSALQLAIQDNLAAASSDPSPVVLGTSSRAAGDLDEFSRNLASLLVRKQNYSWDCLANEPDGPAGPPLADFPNSLMNQVRLWLPYDCGPRQPDVPATQDTTAPTGADRCQHAPAGSAPPRLGVEEWIRLPRRSLVTPRAIAVLDHTGGCADLGAALSTAAAQMGTTCRTLGSEPDGFPDDADVLVILLPPPSEVGDGEAAAEVAAFFGRRPWWPGLVDGVTSYWLVTMGGEAVVGDDAPPNPVHAALAAGFRGIGAENPGVRFRHVDLAASDAPPQAAAGILSAVLTADEPELAIRAGGLYAKRIVEADEAMAGEGPGAVPEHVLVVGGTGKLGLEFCEHFARMGTPRITLVSRSGETAAVSERLGRIRATTATRVRVERCDAADPGEVELIAAKHHDTPADLIIHAALQYSHIELADITPAKAEQALRAKVIGISRVLAAFPRADSCRIVLCSSIGATIGGRGQIVYAAANRMLDAMSRRLRADGVDCVSIQWGPWTVHFDLDTVGMARLVGTGVVPMRPADALSLGMRSLPCNAMVAAFDLARARPILEPYGYGPLLSELGWTAVEQPDRPSMDGLDPAQRFLALLAETIGVDTVDAIDPTVPMVAIGLDSLQALDFRRKVKEQLDHELDVGDLLGGAPIADIVAQLGARP